jgi:aminoglycoside phosphotransferase (APT) family kinase protein
MHGYPWTISGELAANAPWCPTRERISLICRSSLERPGPTREAVADRLLPGWDAWDRLATPAARDAIDMLSDDPLPLIDALKSQPATLIHGDLKLANVGIAADGAVVVVDWQMVMLAPIAIELGWFLVANVASLPLPPDEVIARYRSKLSYAIADAEDDGRWIGGAALNDDGVHAAILVGLLLRGWRKGMDAEAGVTLASGVSAADDLAWWCERAVEAADRLF